VRTSSQSTFDQHLTPPLFYILLSSLFFSPFQCWLEQAGMIEDLKFRGIDVATAYDPTSDDVGVNFIILIALTVGMFGGAFAALKYHLHTGKYSGEQDAAPVPVALVADKDANATKAVDGKNVE
jgi:hypothetical protein